MSKIAYKNYVGIDVSKTKLDIALNETEVMLHCTNDNNGLKELIKLLPGKKSTLIILEATGGYEKLAAHALRKKGYCVAIVNAKRVRDFAKASGKLAKTDCIDAQTIALFGKTFNPIPQPLESDEEMKREAYLTRRAQVIKHLTLEKQYLESASDESIKKEINKLIARLEKALEQVEQKLEDLINQDEILKEKVARLDEIQGVGLITAMNVLIHLPELGTLNHKEVSALVGVAPFNKDSGQSKGKREIRGGRAPVRAALYMAVLSARKFNPLIKQFYDRLIEKGKLKKVAMVACMRKLIIIMNAMMRDGAHWEHS
jgi:transposase